MKEGFIQAFNSCVVERVPWQLKIGIVFSAYTYAHLYVNAYNFICMNFGRQSFALRQLNRFVVAAHRYCFLLSRGIFGGSQIPQTINFPNDNVDKNVVPQK